MALKLPLNFENDIQGKDTNLVPLVVMGNYPNTSNYIVVGTGSSTGTDYDPLTLPLLLGIPSIKESIDVEKRNYKISSVNIDISNYKYNGKRFSEIVSEHEEISSSLINVECRIFWVSPTTDIINFYDSVQMNNNNPLLAYYGIIRKYEHDAEKVKLVVEDRSQSSYHSELPLTDVGVVNVPDKYKNKPIPMVFGDVDKSPCVVTNSAIEPDHSLIANIDILCDEDGSGSAIQISEDVIADGLSIYHNDAFFNIPKVLDAYSEHDLFPELTTDDDAGYGDGLQFQIDDSNANKITLVVSGSNEDSSLNPIGQNKIVGLEIKKLETKVEPYRAESEYYTDLEGIGHSYYTGYKTTAAQEGDCIAGTFNADKGTDNDWHWDRTSQLLTMPEETNADLPDDLSSSEADQLAMPAGVAMTNILRGSGDISDVGTILAYSIYVRAGNFTTDPDSNWAHVYADLLLRVGGDKVGDHADELENRFEIAEYGNSSWKAAFGEAGSYKLENPDRLLISVKRANDEERALGAIRIQFSTLEVYNYLAFSFIDKRNYYAHVKGRVNESPNAHRVINHIIEELGASPADLTGLGEYSDWIYGFTVDKSIDSKKLIEGIASASPFIPRFNNMGEFKFNVISASGGTIGDPNGTVSENHTIKEADVIDFSFSRTPIENVYSKIILKYNWDYARKEFNDSLEVDVQFVLSTNADEDTHYKFEYYGFKDPIPNADTETYTHPDSTLVINDDRGKFFRNNNPNGAGNDQSAENFAYWYLLWSCNQHLKMKVKLPLKYMNLEIGDIINFKEILGGVKPYGINYISPSPERVNAQQVFSKFLITSTNKTLEWCEIECVQMHNLEYACEYDCQNTCNGSAVLDECGVCGGDNASCTDCNGVINGEAYVDGCGVCVGGDTGLAPCPDDCLGNAGGDAVVDGCGICEGGNTTGTSADPDRDCLGVCFGDAYENECGVCDSSPCSPCDDCTQNTSINYNPDACQNNEADCLYAIEADFCPIPTLPDFDEVNYTNYICDFLPSRCDAGVPNDSVFDLTSYGTDTAQMYEEIQSYCSLLPMNCSSIFSADLDSQYPLILSQTNCEAFIGVIEATKVEFVIYDVFDVELQAFEIYPNNIVDHIADQNVMNNLGIIKIRTTYSYNANQYQNRDIDIETNLNMEIETGGLPCSIQTGMNWEQFTDVNDYPIQEILLTSQNENEVVSEIAVDDAYSGYTWWYEYCITEVYKGYRFRISLNSHVSADEGGYAVVELNEIDFNIYDGALAMGDLNEDGLWNILDVVSMVNCVLLTTPENSPCPLVADVNADGSFNILDIVSLVGCVLDNSCVEDLNE